jgi:ribosomal protein S18 acetylase RimI-like enzyme
MQIRKATLADAHTLSALNVDVQKIHADAIPHIFKQPESDSFAVQFMQERLEDPTNLFLIANLDDQDIGYLFARIVDRPENPFMHAWKYIYIDQISVKPRYQGLGCGRVLFQHLRQVTTELGIETILLDTWLFNIQAQAFFKKQGFTTFNYRMWMQI